VYNVQVEKNYQNLQAKYTTLPSSLNLLTKQYYYVSLYHSIALFSYVPEETRLDVRAR